MELNCTTWPPTPPGPRNSTTTGVTNSSATTGITNATHTTGVTNSSATPGITNATGTANVTIGSNGSGTSHNNIQPTLILQYIIKT